MKLRLNVAVLMPDNSQLRALRFHPLSFTMSGFFGNTQGNYNEAQDQYGYRHTA